MGTAGITLGLSIGPAIQICFIPLGSDGISIGPVLLNMYTAAAFLMFAISLLSALIVNIVIVEDYVGIVSDEDKKAAPITIAMYNWTYEEAILYNGIVQVIACAISTITYTIIGSTRVGTWDRRLLLAMGLLGFFFFHFVIIRCHSMKVH
ncbi:hypothetical protein KIN20_004899 [Parelaphostrongylus tenuis]|uniref:Uncharacterized protein n=1 Tax=Parelaphostrongylus tenuis TaxID=148309 RepID=A0AAD5QJN3_PARTN|nr:hypothetical protein KIN20_004899 [Parelaphostrongylus tenuis]